MKKKQFMSKLAALTMAAAMGLTVLPATTVFAQTTTIEASDTKIKAADQVTVTRSYVSSAQATSDDLSDSIKTLLAAHTKVTNAGTSGAPDVETSVDGLDITYKGYDTPTAADLADIKREVLGKFTATAPTAPATDSDYIGATARWDVQDFKFTDADHYTFKLVTDLNGTYTVTVAIDGTTDTSLADAISKLPSSYPSPLATGAPSGHEITNLTTKIRKDLKDAGYNGDATLGGSPTTASAINASRNGIYTNTIDGQAVSVDLTYSSDQKIADTEKSLKTAITGTGVAANTDVVTTSPANSTAAAYADSALIKLTTSDYKATEKSTTKLSQAVQPKDATKAVTKDEAVANLKNYLTAQLTKDKVADNGVSVDVKVVNIASTNDNGATYTVADSNTDGTWTFLVTASIANDFADWSDTEKATTEKNFLVTVNTGKVKTVKATGISLADKTTNLMGDKTVITTAAVGTTPAVTEAATVVTMKAALTPANANTPITYTVADKDGVDVTSKFQLSTTANTVNYVTDANGKAVKATTGAIDLVFKSGDEGTYTVTATSNGKKATATLTVNTKFKDVATGAYYKNAVDWAYKKGVTAGVSDTLFGTNRNVTRAQFVTWLYRNAVADDSTVAIADDDVKEVFSDVATTAYYAKAVQWASENGIADGVGNGKFDPNAEVTRAQAVTFIWRAKGKPDTGAAGEEGEKTTQFTDVDVNSYYMAAVTWATPSVASGLSTTTFGPDQTATRAQAITFIARAYSYN